MTFLDGHPGLRLRGEVDLLTADTLREAIAALPADVSEVHCELAELSFIDVGGARLLLTLAQRPARKRLILHEPSPSLLRLIRLLWPDCLPALSPPDHSEDRATTVSIEDGASAGLEPAHPAPEAAPGEEAGLRG